MSGDLRIRVIEICLLQTEPVASVINDFLWAG